MIVAYFRLWKESGIQRVKVMPHRLIEIALRDLLKKPAKHVPVAQIHAKEPYGGGGCCRLE
jgi:hypothetical protein